MKTREKIIQQAISMFNEQGVHFVGVRDIARELGISPGNLSYHFARKDDIVYEAMQRLRSANDLAYREFYAGPVRVDRFLLLLQKIFNNQYAYRGVTLNTLQLFKDLPTIGFDYATIEQKRRASFRQTFQTFIETGDFQPEVKEEDLDFLVSVLTLTGRFWIAEAQISYQHLPLEQTIRHYLRLLARQFYFFATPQGQKALDAFLE